ncbi:MAG: right-handed parallel beta-helix repeat-containing protein [Fidelibacterota bacterium]|nr:MAG: right-handed parallel beta-helix repeat-containing protein [Candidatus Neomarinimicrobiota bacterium]
MMYGLLPLFTFWRIGLCFCPTNEGGSMDSQRLAPTGGAGDTITVGGPGADITGFHEGAIQQAIDKLKDRGGGVVQLTPGTFHIKAPVNLCSGLELAGSGSATVLRKVDGFSTRLLIDADYGERQLTVENPSDFEPGTAVHVYDADHNNAWEVSTAVITTIEGDIIHLDSYLLRDYRADKEGGVSTASSIVAAVKANEVTIRNLNVDGNRHANEFINGCRGGGIYLYDVRNALIESVTVTNFNGDGISWQMTRDVTVRNCTISQCSKDGLHPGTGSYSTLIEGNTSSNNDRHGLYICWRVQNGMVKQNRFHHNRNSGISTGHKDTDMVFEQNHIYENGTAGVHFRKEREANAPHRNLFQQNTIENNGLDGDGYGFLIESPAEGTILEGNTIRDTGSSAQKAAVYLSQRDISIELKDNLISGHRDGEIVFGDE